jgi:Na+/proline symporter
MGDLPRFGHSSDFSLLFSGNSQEKTDYALGLLFIGAFLLAVFLVWLIVVAVLKCVPSSGFMSGARFQTSHKEKRPRRVRTTFVVAATLWIIFTILLVTEGITNLQDTVLTVAASNQVSMFRPAELK